MDDKTRAAEQEIRTIMAKNCDENVVQIPPEVIKMAGGRSGVMRLIEKVRLSSAPTIHAHNFSVSGHESCVRCGVLRIAVEDGFIAPCIDDQIKPWIHVSSMAPSSGTLKMETTTDASGYKVAGWVAHPRTSLPEGAMDDMRNFGTGLYVTQADGTNRHIRPEDFMYDDARMSTPEEGAWPEPSLSTGNTHLRLAALFAQPVVTPEMREAGLAEYSYHAVNDIGWPEVESIYRAMHAVALVLLVSEAENTRLHDALKVRTDERDAARSKAAAEQPTDIDYNGPVKDGRAIPDPVHEQFHRAVDDVLSGKVMPAARRQMQEALKQAPKEPVAAPDAILRGNKASVGMLTGPSE